MTTIRRKQLRRREAGWEGSCMRQLQGDGQKDDRRRCAWDKSAQDDKIL